MSEWNLMSRNRRKIYWINSVYMEKMVLDVYNHIIDEKENPASVINNILVI